MLKQIFFIKNSFKIALAAVMLCLQACGSFEPEQLDAIVLEVEPTNLNFAHLEILDEYDSIEFEPHIEASFNTEPKQYLIEKFPLYLKTKGEEGMLRVSILTAAVTMLPLPEQEKQVFGNNVMRKFEAKTDLKLEIFKGDELKPAEQILVNLVNTKQGHADMSEVELEFFYNSFNRNIAQGAFNTIIQKLEELDKGYILED